MISKGTSFHSPSSLTILRDILRVRALCVFALRNSAKSSTSLTWSSDSSLRVPKSFSILLVAVIGVSLWSIEGPSFTSHMALGQHSLQLLDPHTPRRFPCCGHLVGH